MSLRTLPAILLCLLLVSTAAAAKKLKEGDAAPGLDIETWVQGQETTLEKGKTYILVFFSTHGRGGGIGNLSELQDRYEQFGLTVIAVSTEDKGLVEKWAKLQRNLINFTVAADRRESTQRAWMKAAEVERLPTAFMVDKNGRVQFIGSPDEQHFVDILEMVLDGRYDARLFREAEPVVAAAKSARKTRNWRMCERYYDELLEKDRHVFAYYTLQKFEVLLLDQGRKDEAYEYARKVIEEYGDDPSLLGALAVKIASDTKIPKADRDLDVALQAAEAAAKMADRDEPKKYSVPALVLYHAGRLDEAVALQKKAYFVAHPTDKARCEHVLRIYQQALARQSSAGTKTGE